MSQKQRPPAGRHLPSSNGRIGHIGHNCHNGHGGHDAQRELALRRRRSRVPWIYGVYHARERRTEEPARSDRFEEIDPLDLFEPADLPGAGN